MIPYRYLAFGDHPAHSYWDQTLIDDIFLDSRFYEVNSFDEELKGGIVIIPGAYQSDYIDEINKEINRYEWIILIITSDEESKFPIEKIKHPNIRIHVQYPKKPRHNTYEKFPIGYTKETRKHLSLKEKDLDFFFSGQVTNSRRRQCVEQLRNMENGLLVETKGFSQGLKTDEYMENMNRAKVVPAPAGGISADSFRLYEALEAGAVPIGDNISDSGDVDFWGYMFGAVHFYEINEYKNLPEYIKGLVQSYPHQNNRSQAWWIKFKRDLKERLVDEVEELSGIKNQKYITVVIPVSPIKSHPDTRVLNETIMSVREQLPDAEIIITFDGVRAEKEDKRKDYEEFIRRALFLCNTTWNAVPIIFENHTHQAGMLKSLINYIKTPTILYVEQDTPLTTDKIDFQKCILDIISGKANVIRFHFEAFIPEPHKHMILGEVEDGLLKTVQWSQRPALASTLFYKRILAEHFSNNSNCFIEDVLHGKLWNDYVQNGMQAWNQWRVFIYHPEGSIKRSTHTDGREGEAKFDDTQVW